MSVRFLSGINVDSNTLFVDSANDRVGIGTASPSEKFSLYGGDAIFTQFTGAGNGSFLKILNSTTTTNGTTLQASYFGSGGFGDLKFEVGGSERLRITSAGNVGIGTTNPVSPLDVNGIISSRGIFVAQNSGTYNLIYNASNSVSMYLGGSADQGNYYDNTTHYFRSSGGSSTYAVINYLGNVGIGTTAPGVKLDVLGVATIRDSSGGGALNIGTSSGRTQYQYITLGGGNGGVDYGWQIGRSPQTGGVINDGFYIYDIKTNNTPFAIALGGNVGIGTTSPAYKLDVNGEINARSNSQVSGNAQVFTIDGTNHAYYAWSVAGSRKAYAGFGSSGSTTFELINENTGGFIIGTNGSQQFIITSAGNVGIGTTAPSEKLHVVGNIKVEQTSNVNAVLTLNPNSGVLGTGYQWNLVGVNSAASYAFQIREASSTYLTITNSAGGTGGNVGIGTTSPSSKLQVNVGTDQNVAINSTGGVARISAYDDAVANSVPLIINGSDLRFTNNASEAVRITGGNVGIGTTSPQDKLTVKGATNYNLNLGLLGGYSGIYVYNDASSAYNHLRIDASPLLLNSYSGGNVGIGTTSPSAKLEVNVGLNSLKISGRNTYVDSSEDATNANIYVTQDGVGDFGQLAGNLVLQARTQGTVYRDIIFAGGLSNGDALMTILGEGNVGIGTTSPISYSGYTTLGIDNASSGGVVDFMRSGTSTFRIGADSTGNFLYGATSLPMVFSTNTNERMRITSDGNVLIGTTTNSGEKLFVQGAGRFVNQLRAYNLLSDNQIKGSAYVELSPDQTTYNAWNIRVGAQAADACYYITGGGVNILTTEGYNNPYTVKLYSNGVQTLTMTNGSVRLNTYGSGSKTGTVAYNLAVDSSGNIIETAGGVVDGSGTANYVSKWSDANTLTDSVIYDNGTNVGIGTTPNQGVRLQVAGAVDAWDSLNTLLRLRHDGTRGKIQSYTGGGYSPTALNADGGNVLIGTDTDAGYKLDVSGTGRFTDTLTASSTAGGTSAIFQNTGAQNSNGIELRGGTAGTSVNWKIEKDNTVGNAFQITPSTANGGTTYTTPSLTIASTGAATFSSSVTAVNYSSTIANKATLATASGAINVPYTTSNINEFQTIGFSYPSSVDNVTRWGMAMTATNYASGLADLIFFTATTERLRIDNAGAATFSSSVTASSLIKSGGTSAQYLMADGSVSTLTNPVTGTGTTNYVPKWTGASALGDSLMVSNSTGIGIGISNPTNRLYVQGQDSNNLYDNIIAVFRGAGTSTTNYAEVYIQNDAYDALVLGSIGSNYSGSSWAGARYIYAATGDLMIKTLDPNTNLRFYTAGAANERMRITSAGNVLIGTTTNAGYKLDVSGDVRGNFFRAQNSTTTGTTILSYSDQFKQVWTTLTSFSFTGAGVYYFNLVFQTDYGFTYDLTATTSRDGLWRNFGTLRDNSYLNVESDGDFETYAVGDVQIISNDMYLDAAPTAFKSATTTASGVNGTSPWAYYIVRYAVYIPTYAGNTSGFFKVHLTTYGYDGNAPLFINA